MTSRAWVEHLMGMPVSIHVRCPDPRSADIERAVAAAHHELARLEDVFSTWRPDSHVSRLARGEIALAHCDPLMGEVIALCAEATHLTGGAFTAHLPDHTGQRLFNPTGLVKGWAVDRAGEILSGLPGAAWCINAGGDLLAGRHCHVPPAGQDALPWRIGIEDPHDRSRIARVVPVIEGAVATSGTAARGAHLYDPRSDRWIDRLASVTVAGPELMWADMWATALFVGGEDAARAFDLALEARPGYSWWSQGME